MSIFSPKITQVEGLVVASTNEANTAEPWGTILELCDVVSREDKSDEAAKFMLRRLKTPNGRVQLQTIKLYLAAATNCGLPFRIAMCTRKFAEQVKAMLKKPGACDRSVATELKSALLTWELDFAGEVQLGIIRVTLNELRRDGVNFDDATPGGASHPQQGGGGSSNGGPSAQQLKDQEEDDLQMALAQSMSEAESKQTSSSSSYYSSQSSQQQQQQQQTPPPANIPAVHKRAQCLYDFEASETNEVSLKAGQELIVTDESDPHWWCGVSQTGQQGFFPASFVTYAMGPTPQELAAAAAAEQARAAAEAAAAVPIKRAVVVDEAKLYRTLGMLNMAEPTSSLEQLAEIDGLEHECDEMLPMIEAMIDAHETAEAELQALNRRFEAATTLHANLQGMVGGGQMAGGAQMQPWQMQQLPPHMRQGFQMQQPPTHMQQYNQQQYQQMQQQQGMPPQQQQQGSPYTDRRQAPHQFQPQQQQQPPPQQQQQQQQWGSQPPTSTGHAATVGYDPQQQQQQQPLQPPQQQQQPPQQQQQPPQQQQQPPAAFQAQPQAPQPVEAPKPTAADLLGDLLGGDAFKPPAPALAPAPAPVQQQQQPVMQMQQQMNQLNMGGGMPPQQQQQQQQQGFTPQQQMGGMPPQQRLAGFQPQQQQQQPQQGFAPQHVGGMPPQQQQQQPLQQQGGFIAPGQFAHQPPPQQQQQFYQPR